MEVLEDYQYFVRYEVESRLHMDSEDEGYLTKIYGSILRAESDDDEDGVMCGHIRVSHLRCDEMTNNDDFDPRGWGKVEGDEMHEITRSMYRKNGEWVKPLEEMWGVIDPMDLLVINEIELNKDHRGRGVGLQVVSRTIDLFGQSCGMAALCPWPTEIDDPKNEELTRMAHRKLAKYSERLGFKNLMGTDVWVRSLVHEISRTEN